jgi:hypothetical protein
LLEPFGTNALIEALRRSFFNAMHVEEMWHSDWASVSKIPVFRGITNVAYSFPAEGALAIELQQPCTDGVGRYALWPSNRLRAAVARGLSRAATRATHRDKWRHATTLSEFKPPFLNGEQRSVNRKVQARLSSS